MISTVVRRALMTSQSARPIVAVIGTTGVGKSQLAVTLAQSLKSRDVGTSKGVVLSADSMQLYKCLDVITNKVTQEEMGGVEHWGLNLVTPGEGSSWEVGRWCNEANEKIASLDQTDLPIVCGGTHYFIQHFLFPPNELSLARKPSLKGKEKAEGWTPPGLHPPVELDEDQRALLESFWKPEPAWPASTSTSTEDHQLLSLYRLLEVVDPDEAGRWHWRDGRKVKRGLERWWESAPEPREGSPSGRRARFRTLVFWVYQPLDLLRPKLDKRVDAMVENGLLREIAELRGIAERLYGSADEADHTEGIFQSIGYKEFSKLNLDQADPTQDPSFPPMLERMKLSTVQYARSQLKWIKKQFLPAAAEAKRLGGDVWVYVVPGGAEGEYAAKQVFQAFLDGESMPDPRGVGRADASALLDLTSDGSIPDTSARQKINARQNCEICSTPDAPYSVMTRDWDRHIRSKIHKRNVDDRDGGRERRKAESIARGQAVREQRAAAASIGPRPDHA